MADGALPTGPEKTAHAKPDQSNSQRRQLFAVIASMIDFVAPSLSELGHLCANISSSATRETS